MKWLVVGLCVFWSGVALAEWRFEQNGDAQKKLLDVKSGSTLPTERSASGMSQAEIVNAVLSTTKDNSSFRQAQGWEMLPVSLGVKGSLLDPESPYRYQDNPARYATIQTDETNPQTSSFVTSKRSMEMVSGSRPFRRTSLMRSDVTIKGADKVQITSSAACSGQAQGIGRTRWFPGKRLMMNRQARRTQRARGFSYARAAGCSGAKAACAGSW